jgi:DNA-binding response OmpR family regulator
LEVGRWQADVLCMRDQTELRRVVVADDERDIAGLLTMNLEMEGYIVETVYDGASALDTIRGSLPDFVLLDVMMPKLNGLDVLRELKADPATADIPVIMLTAKAGDDDLWAGWSAGASYYLTKPFDLDELLRYLAYLEDPVNHVAPDAEPNPSRLADTAS